MLQTNDMAEARRRLGRMNDAVAGFDRQIATLERERDRAPKTERLRFGGRIAGLQADRAAAQELVNAAQEQLAEQEAARAANVEATRNRLSEITGTCGDAALRFDRALQDAAAALAELETNAGALVSAGFLTRSGSRYFRHADVMAAIAHALGDQLGREWPDRKPMEQRVALAVANARENAARSRQREG